ncbi:hypothetical protein K7T73_16595 [Bacillus badius]|uniref:hypothetical protein n=1 Tax=Bacillus badius TaxID=1455 RepID=UPI001CC1BE86|nr:hypothetical protein [Bacillus badius]UAT30151.1 hypothetical protein K7T73_16595 [Bacillus badius]
MYKAFHFGFLTNLTGIFTLFIYLLSTEIVHFTRGLKEEDIFLPNIYWLFLWLYW